MFIFLWSFQWGNNSLVLFLCWFWLRNRSDHIFPSSVPSIIFLAFRDSPFLSLARKLHFLFISSILLPSSTSIEQLRDFSSRQASMSYYVNFFHVILHRFHPSFSISISSLVVNFQGVPCFSADRIASLCMQVTPPPPDIFLLRFWLWINDIFSLLNWAHCWGIKFLYFSVAQTWENFQFVCWVRVSWMRGKFSHLIGLHSFLPASLTFLQLLFLL